MYVTVSDNLVVSLSAFKIQLSPVWLGSSQPAKLIKYLSLGFIISEFMSLTSLDLSTKSTMGFCSGSSSSSCSLGILL